MRGRRVRARGRSFGKARERALGWESLLRLTRYMCLQLEFCAHLLGGLAAAIVTVAGRSKDVPEFTTKSGSILGISPRVAKLAKNHGEHVEGINIGSQSEIDGLGLKLKGAKETIPDDKNSSVVSIEIEGVASMVNSVMGGRVEDPFKRTELADELGMNPVLVDEANAVGEYDLFWRKPE